MRIELTNRFLNVNLSLFEKDTPLGIRKSSEWSKIFLRALETNYSKDRISEPFKEYGWVYVAVREIAVTISQIPFKLHRDDTVVEEGETYELFKRPNPQISRYQLWESILTLLCLDGNAILVPWSTGGTKRPDQLWVFPRERFEVDVNPDTGHLRAYIFRAKNQKIPLLPEQVVHFKLFNPYDTIWGLSPVTVARVTMEADLDAAKYNRAMLENDASPSGVLTTDHPLNEKQIKLLREQWEARHKGASKAGKISVLEGGMKYQQLSLSQKDMEFLETRRYNREEILALWQVPKSLVGITEDINRATAFAHRKAFWNDTLLPYVRLIEDGLNSGFFKGYAPELVGKFDTSSVAELQDDFTEKVKNAEMLAKMGFPINQINERLDLGFEAVTWGDTHLVPMSMIPVEMAGRVSEEQSTPPKDEPKALPASIRVVQGEEVRLTRWLEFLRVIEPIERRFASKMQRYFFEQRNELLELLHWGEKESADAHAKEVDDVTLFMWDEQDRKLKEIAKPLYTEAMARGSQIVADYLDVDPFDVRNPLIEVMVLKRCDHITQINETIKRQIVDQLQDGLIKGESIAQLSDRVKKCYQMARHRALTIARTETVGAVNEAELKTMEDEGVAKKIWLTAGDEAVRESHVREGQGEAVKVTDKFPITGLYHPGDPQGSAAETVNCRCAILPDID